VKRKCVLYCSKQFPLIGLLSWQRTWRARARSNSAHKEDRKLYKLHVVFACDTEDNHPSYVPGWRSRGSNYDSNPSRLEWSWTRYWHDLSELFRRRGVPITWLIRVDNGPMWDCMLSLFRDEILGLKSVGDEIGIHIHTYVWRSKLSKWVQTIDRKNEVEIVTRSIEMFERGLGFVPCSVRMGWNTMSNEIMRTLDSRGLLVDASAIPGTYCLGKFGNRDNIYDWSKASREPYHPRSNDYQRPGNMKILEMPISTCDTDRSTIMTGLINRLSAVKGSSALLSILPLVRRFDVNPNAGFYISPWWSLSVSKRIIRTYCKKACKDGVAYLIGFFHPCDIIDPKTGKKNALLEKCISTTIKEIQDLSNIDVNFTTLSKIASIFEEEV